MDDQTFYGVNGTTESTTLHLDALTTIMIQHEATLGDLLIATLLTVLIVLYVSQWVYRQIWGDK